MILDMVVVSGAWLLSFHPNCRWSSPCGSPWKHYSQLWLLEFRLRCCTLLCCLCLRRESRSSKMKVFSSSTFWGCYGYVTIEMLCWCYDQACSGDKAFIPKQLKSQSGLLGLHMGACQWRFVNGRCCCVSKPVTSWTTFRNQEAEKRSSGCVRTMSFEMTQFGTTDARYHNDRPKKKWKIETQPIDCWSRYFFVEKLPGRPRFLFEIQIWSQMNAENCQNSKCMVLNLSLFDIYFVSKRRWNFSEVSAEVSEIRCSWEARQRRDTQSLLREKVAYLYLTDELEQRRDTSEKR